MVPMALTSFLRSVSIQREKIADATGYPFTIPAIAALDTLELHPQVTFFVGENGSGKSTLLEAIAVATGFNAEGGSTNFRFSTRSEESALAATLRVVRGTSRPRTGFFLRAESFYNVASEIERLAVGGSYGDKSLHEQSHGESFMALVNNRFGAHGLYLLDEPEAALSPQRQLALLHSIDRLVRHDHSQLLIATHSPIILAYPNATIYWLSETGIETVAYEQTEHYSLTRDFLNNRERYLRRLLADPE